jgi:hypothetical protein
MITFTKNLAKKAEQTNFKSGQTIMVNFLLIVLNLK